MAQLRSRDRSKLPDSAFAYVDSSGRRRLPIHDEPHVRNALARFGRIEFEDEAARDRARTRVLKAAKRYGIVPIGFIDGQLRPSSRLPKGNVTLLFADIEGSTRHIAELGDAYGPMLDTMRRVLRAATRRAGGHEVDARADEYFAVFPAATAAIEAALAIQRGVATTQWNGGREVRVRVGLHHGRPTLTPSGYVGIAVNTSARICAAGHGGQVVVSKAARNAIGDEPPYELRALGVHRLRGIPEAQELFQLVAAGLADGFPPLRTTT